MPVARIDVLSVPVTDQDRARAFYEGLGFTVTHDNRVSPDMRRLHLAAPGGGTDIVLATWLQGVPPGSLQGVFLEVADLDADRAALTAADVAVEEPMETPWGRFAGLADPDGNGWTLHQPPVAGVSR